MGKRTNPLKKKFEESSNVNDWTEVERSAALRGEEIDPLFTHFKPCVSPCYNYAFPAACPHDYHNEGATASNNVFQRLTDYRFYTGSHKNRFDEFGNGRGIAGRDDVYVIDGAKKLEVYSTVIRKPKKPVVEPGTLGVQKYGVQNTTPRMIWLFRNGDKKHQGEPFWLYHYFKKMNQVMTAMSKTVELWGGPVRKIYDQNFESITHLGEFVDGAKYLCTAGEPPAPWSQLENFLSGWILRE